MLLLFWNGSGGPPPPLPGPYMLTLAIYSPGPGGPTPSPGGGPGALATDISVAAPTFQLVERNGQKLLLVEDRWARMRLEEILLLLREIDRTDN